MDMTKAIILEENIDDKLWPKIILAISYIKNNCLTRIFASNVTSHKAQSQENITNVLHLQVTGSSVYVFLHKEKRFQKSEKWAP